MAISVEGQQPIPGAALTERYLIKLKDKNIGVVCNQTSRVGQQHLVDFLIDNKISVVKIFSPEHGFRGDADAGAKVLSETDSKTGIKIKSLYGKNFKPTQEDLKGIDVLVFDIQDVGVRFYTYISTLQYVLESSANAKIPLILLDRPNPNGHYIDGPVLDRKMKSFVGLTQIPIVYGMTIGEYAKMLVGERWIESAQPPILEVIPCQHYTHRSRPHIEIPPSPNLKSDLAIALYPSLCLFEGTDVSVGRGTETPFEIYGSPYLDRNYLKDSFMPVSRKGASSPPFMNQMCYGENLSVECIKNRINLSYILKAYRLYTRDKKHFFLKNLFFDKLAGNTSLRWQIIKGKTEKEIVDSWIPDLKKFKIIREKYLLYEDFE